MSSENAKAYRRLAKILAKTFDDGSDTAVQRILDRLPEPGSPWPQHPPPEFPMPWAQRWGQDEYGVWCGFEIGGAAQRMRWIPPGEFWMGSRPDEPERGGDEDRHPVKLTSGFWLAETACTQALWRAVTGKNPSAFKGDDRPLESISWEDTQTFCGKLNAEIPELDARLPSEAEWEYACRAGTETPFWWGRDLCTDLANYDGSIPYADSPKGEYRKTTVAANHFDTNLWGLYQMQGNVWECCEDWYDEYAVGEKTIVDPHGPARGSIRVFRGGSWLFFGRWLRAAYRYSDQPGMRVYDLGFRLAAGPRPGGAEKQ